LQKRIYGRRRLNYRKLPSSDCNRHREHSTLSKTTDSGIALAADSGIYIVRRVANHAYAQSPPRESASSSSSTLGVSAPQEPIRRGGLVLGNLRIIPLEDSGRYQPRGWGWRPEGRHVTPREFTYSLIVTTGKPARKQGSVTQSPPNQLPDPTSPSVTPPAGAGVAPSVAADH
jgi:hypothetical protein